MSKTPLAQVKADHGDKAQLVQKIQKLATPELWLDRVNSEKGLGRVSNAKLLRLLAALEDAKKRFGTRAKLNQAILDLEKRSKDEGYQARLSGYPLPRLLDLHDAQKKQAASLAKKAAPKAEKKPAKKAAAKKTVKKAAAK